MSSVRAAGDSHGLPKENAHKVVFLTLLVSLGCGESPGLRGLRGPSSLELGYFVEDGLENISR